MQSVKDALGNMKHITLNVYYDKWLCPGSKERAQYCIRDIPIEEFAKRFGDWQYEGWYTTSIANGQTHADIWVGAAGDYRYIIPHYSADLYKEYKDAFLSDIRDFAARANQLFVEQPYKPSEQLLRAAAGVLTDYADAEICFETGKDGMVTLTDYDASVGIDHTLAVVCLNLPYERMHDLSDVELSRSYDNEELDR